MKKVGIEQFVDGLSGIAEGDFTLENVYDFLASNPVDAASLDRYFFFSEKFYTRNLICRSDLFELMAICWSEGQVSKVHNHAGQNCWMAVPVGRLKVQNFRILELDENSSFCRLEESQAFSISSDEPCRVEHDEPIHQVLNLAEHAERAVSLHIYSKPIESCYAYCMDSHTYKEVNLCYTSVNGKLCDGVTL